MAVFGLIFAWLAATAWVRPLAEPDEGRYAGVAFEMLAHGHWGVPTLAGLPFFHKPPLFYWISAAAMSVFGPHEWAARFASVLGATLASFAIYQFGARWVSERAARLTLLVLLTQPLWFFGAQFANLDMLVAGCISATVLLAAHAARQIDVGAAAQRTIYTAWFFAALGVLAKGLIGVVLPALVIVIWLALSRRLPLVWRLLWPPALALFALVAAPWFISMQMQFPAFLHYFVVVQHVQRFAQSGFNNMEPWWFYPAVMAVLSLPWLAWMGVVRRAGYWQEQQHDPVRLLMWVWLAVVVGFFSLPESKLVGYVLPALPPLAFVIADAVQAARLSAVWRRHGLMVSTATSLAVCSAALAVFVIWQPRSTQSLAIALKAERRSNEPVFFLDSYPYDITLYAGLQQPPKVVGDWANPDLLKHDNWHKELADAASFAPDAASSTLILPGAVAGVLCHAGVSWVLGPAAATVTYPVLPLAREIARTDEMVLWKVDPTLPSIAHSLGCP